MARPDLGFTTRATCLVTAGLTALLIGLVFGEIDLVRAGLLAAALPGAAALLVRRAQVHLADRRSVDPPQLQAGSPMTVTLTVTNRSGLRTGALMLEDTVPPRVPGRARFVLDPLAAGESRTVTYRLPRLNRGRYRVGPLRIRLGDPFGLIDLSRSFRETSDVVVAPVVDPLAVVALPRSEDIGDNAGSRSVGVHGADDQSTRDYRTGDDLRKIHWRSSARRGALMVRQEEQPWQGNLTVLLDLRAGAHVTGSDADSDTDPRALSSAEWAISAAASIGTHVLSAGRKLTLTTVATGGQDGRVPDRTALIGQLAELDMTPTPDLAQAAGSLRATGADSTLIAVLGRLDTASLDALVRASGRGRSAPAYAMLLDVDSWSGSSTARHSDAQAPRLVGAARVLRSAGWRVVVVERPTSVAQAWQLLFAAAGERRTADAR